MYFGDLVKFKGIDRDMFDMIRLERSCNTYCALFIIEVATRR